MLVQRMHITSSLDCSNLGKYGVGMYLMATSPRDSNFEFQNVQISVKKAWVCNYFTKLFKFRISDCSNLGQERRGFLTISPRYSNFEFNIVITSVKLV